MYGCTANNELLPFADGIFDIYIANLSLMLVNNHLNQIKEAFRILQKGSIAAFTIWGNEGECLLYTLVEAIMEKNFPRP